MQKISLSEVSYVTVRLARELMGWDEPIPSFNTRFPGVLESCLLTPFQSFAQKSLYHGLESKSAILFYLMIKNHPFKNGNKRIAVTTLIYFLYKNKKWLDVDNQSLYRFAKWVAESDTKYREEVFLAIHKFVKLHMTSRD